MKKTFLAIALLLISFFLVPSYNSISAESEPAKLKINTVYPENVVDYVDLTNINKISINETYIAYTLDNTNLILFNKSTKEYKQISNFTNIRKLHYINNQLLVVDDTNIKVLNSINVNTSSDLSTLDSITFDNLKAIDIFTSNQYTFIGLINNQTFELYKFNNNLTNITNSRIKTTQASQFASAYMLTISDSTAYIVTNSTEPKIHTINLKIENASIVTKDFKTYAQLIESFQHNNKEYVVSFTQENLYLFDSSLLEISRININDTTNILPIQELTDICYFDGSLYACDKRFKTIQTFIVNDTESTKLQIDKIILGSNSKDIGRFDNVYDFHIQGDQIFISDTNNERIQILSDNKIKTITLEEHINPKSIVIDKSSNVYYIKDIANTSSLVKMLYNGGNYVKNAEISKSHDQNIGFISDITITNSGVIYLLDKSNHRLLYYTSPSIEIKKNLGFAVNNNAQIEYLKKLDKLVVLSGNTIYLLDLNGNLLSEITIPNTTNITIGLDFVIAHSGNNINHIDIINNNLTTITNSISSDSFSHYSKIKLDIINNVIYGFDSNRHCLEYFDYNLADLPTFNQEDITNTESLTTNNLLLPITLINNFTILEYPYILGNIYNLDKSITNVIAIQEYNNYYRVLFNINDTLKSGYIEKVYAKIENLINNPIEVITTNQEVSIYKYPTILQYNGSTITTKELEINTVITLIAPYPISIDDKQFYLYRDGNNIGFIFNADVILNESKNIVYLKNNNATLKLIGTNETKILDKDKTTELYTLYNGDRIYVENYDKNSVYTKIVFKTQDLETIEGYILTKDIQMDKMDNSTIVIIIITIISTLLLVVIAISYFITKKRASNKK